MTPPERGQLDADERQPLEQVAAQASLLDRRLEARFDCSNRSDVQLDPPAFGGYGNLAVPKHPVQLRLHAHRHLGEVHQEQGPA